LLSAGEKPRGIRPKEKKKKDQVPEKGKKKRSHWRIKRASNGAPTGKPKRSHSAFWEKKNNAGNSEGSKRKKKWANRVAKKRAYDTDSLRLMPKKPTSRNTSRAEKGDEGPPSPSKNHESGAGGAP